MFAPFGDEGIKRVFAFRKFLRFAQSHAVKHISPLRGLLSKLIIILIPPTGYYVFFCLQSTVNSRTRFACFACFLFLTECTEETDAMWIFISNWCKKSRKYLLLVKKYITFAVVNINDCFMTCNSTYYRILGGFLIGG